jgi:hypothetical protein
LDAIDGTAHVMGDGRSSIQQMLAVEAGAAAWSTASWTPREPGPRHHRRRRAAPRLVVAGVEVR